MFRCAKMVFFHILHVRPRYEGVHAHQGGGQNGQGDRTWKTGRLKRSLDHGPMPEFRGIQVCFFSTVFPCFDRLDHTHPFSSACRMVASKLVPEIDTSLFFCDNSWRTLAGTVWCYYYRYYPLVI